MNDQNRLAATPELVLSRNGLAVPIEEDETNFRELFDIIWSGKWIVVAVAAACLVLGAAYALIARPEYEADGLVQVEEEKNGISAQMDQLSSLIGGTPTQAPAEIAVLKSRMVLGAVAEKLKLYIEAEPKYFPVFGEAIARRRDELLRLPLPFGLGGYAWGGEQIRVTSLEVPESLYGKLLTLVAKQNGFDLFDESGTRLLSGKVGERTTGSTTYGTVNLFVQKMEAKSGTRFYLTRKSIQTVLSELAEQVTITEQPRDSGVLSLKVQAESAAFAAQLINEIEEAYLRQNVERRSAQAEQSLEFLKKQLPDLKEKVDEAQARLNSYQLQRGTIDVKQETDLILKQAVDLETQRLQLVQQRDAALQRFTGQHPVVTSLSEQIRGIEREQQNLKKKVETLPETQQEILGLMRDVEVNEQLYTALLNSAQELQVTRAGTIGNVRIIDSGLPPLKPVKPKKGIVIAVSILVGGFLGVLTVFAMRALLRGVDRPEDIERVVGLPTYASIPFSTAQRKIMGKRADQTSESISVLAGTNADDLAVEALRSLRTSLHFAMLEASNNIVMFTGPTAGLGKSFVSINFGAVLAQAGKRVVVIDADLRRGRLHRYLGVKKKPGLSDYIASSGESPAIINSTAIEGLDFIAAGTRPPNPSEILMHSRLAEMLKALSARYDYVLIDTPPVLPVTDAAIVGQLAGTTLVVLKAAEHPMRAIEETVRRLRQAGVHVRGMIFNQVGARVGSYGYGSYGYAYGYSAYGYKAGNKNG